MKTSSAGLGSHLHVLGAAPRPAAAALALSACENSYPQVNAGMEQRLECALQSFLLDQLPDVAWLAAGQVQQGSIGAAGMAENRCFQQLQKILRAPLQPPLQNPVALRGGKG